MAVPPRQAGPNSEPGYRKCAQSTGKSSADVRVGSASEVSAFEDQVCITRMNGHRQFDWVASRNIGRRLGRAVGYTGCASERTGRQPVAPMAPTLILDSCCDPDGFLLHQSRANLRWR